MQPRPAADEGCLRNWKLHSNANLRSRCWCPLSFSASQEQRADSSPYFASGELCHNSWRADTDTVYFQHLLAYRTSAQSCSVWDLINGTLVGLLTDGRHFPPSSIYEHSVESTGTRRPNARLPISFEVPRCTCDILLETQDFYEVLLHISYIQIILETEIKQ